MGAIDYGAAPLSELVACANARDARAVEEIRRRHESDPDGLIALGNGDVAGLARMLLVQSIAPIERKPLAHFATEAWIGKIAGSVAGPDAPALERLLAERIALCWADVHRLDSYWSGLFGGDGGGADIPSKLMKLDTLRDRAHGRLLKAIRTLATVRRVDLTSLIQVNVDGRSVNLLGDGAHGLPADRAAPALDCTDRHR